MGNYTEEYAIMQSGFEVSYSCDEMQLPAYLLSDQCDG
jgi:hypothetical protein